MSTKDGSGHPLPASEEARTEDLPEHLVREKGQGDDAGEAVQRAGHPVDPDGKAYALERDRAAHEDQSRSFIENPDRG